MPTNRCTHLILKGLFNGFDEMWISDQPYLLLTYVATYMPWWMRLIGTKIAGPGRIKALKEGTNLFDTKALLNLKN